jgi:redox-sensitive bicupin YhaK (pirin superfamily)
MITIRKGEDRGYSDLGWLDSLHTFSFGSYHEPAHMGFRALRVLNEDRVEPGQGFGAHPHMDMEILSYVLEGALEHQDSTGSSGVLRPGEVQRMSAGTGVIHSEYNASTTDRVHSLQIWILPDRKGRAPEYEQKAFPAEERKGRWRALASPDGRDGSLRIHQDVALYGALLEPGQELAASLPPTRHAWLQVVRGNVTLNGVPLEKGDGAAVSDERSLAIQAVEPAELLLFDLA